MKTQDKKNMLSNKQKAENNKHTDVLTQKHDDAKAFIAKVDIKKLETALRQN